MTGAASRAGSGDTSSGPIPPDSGPVFVFVFDGDCGFCTHSARKLRAWLPAEVAVEPSQALDLQALGLTAEGVARASWWVDTESQQALEGAAGISAALRHAEGLPRLAGLILDLPGVRWIAERSYRLVARNRHRLPGSTDACSNGL